MHQRALALRTPFVAHFLSSLAKCPLPNLCTYCSDPWNRSSPFGNLGLLGFVIMMRRVLHLATPFLSDHRREAGKDAQWH